MGLLRNYFRIFKGEPHFTDEIPDFTHHAVELFIADGKLVAQKTLFDAREELISTEFREDSRESKEVKRQEP